MQSLPHHCSEGHSFRTAVRRLDVCRARYIWPLERMFLAAFLTASFSVCWTFSCVGGRMGDGDYSCIVVRGRTRLRSHVRLSPPSSGFHRVLSWRFLYEGVRRRVWLSCKRSRRFNPRALDFSASATQCSLGVLTCIPRGISVPRSVLRSLWGDLEAREPLGAA